jgi:hypothetical protein
MYNIVQGDEAAARRIIEQTVAELGEWGLSEAA